MSFSKSVAVVWLRYFAVFRKNLWYGLMTTFVEPLLYLGSFGFGLGGVIGNIHVGDTEVSYRAFVLAGLVGQTVLFQAFFEGAYGGFVRMYYQKIFQAIAVTPVTLSEVLWGELLWCSSRATLSASVVLLIGSVLGDFSVVGALALVPFTFVAALLFAAFGMLVAGWSKTIESINYPQYLAVFPMFLFCGVFYPVANLPKFLAGAVELLPLTAILNVVRGLTLGFEVGPGSWCLTAAWVAVLLPLARREMRKRLLA